MNQIPFDPFFVLSVVCVLLVFRIIHLRHSAASKIYTDLFYSIELEDWLVPFLEGSPISVIDIAEGVRQLKKNSKVPLHSVCEMYYLEFEELFGNDWIEICGDAKVKINGVIYPATFKLTQDGIAVRNKYMSREKISISTAWFTP